MLHFSRTHFSSADQRDFLDLPGEGREWLYLETRLDREKADGIGSDHTGWPLSPHRVTTADRGRISRANYFEL